MVIQIKEIVFSGREGSLKRLVITDETGVARKVLTSEWLVPGDYIQISPIQLQNGEDGFAGGKVSTPVVQEVVVQEPAASSGASPGLIAQLFGPIYIGMCNVKQDSLKTIADQALVEATRIAGKISLLEKLQK
jgi:hypothetical protein